MEERHDLTTQLLPTVEMSPDAQAAPAVFDAEKIMQDIPVKPQERYKFIRSIGFGGMKGVLLVYDKDMEREVAMAIMPDFKERPYLDRVRFVYEAKLTARMEHPNIVPVHDLGLDKNGSPYFVMKYLQGTPLSGIMHRLRRGDEEMARKYTLRRRLDIFIRLCRAMIFAHSQGVLHLDLKPDNVHIGTFDEVVLLDWGLARYKNENPPWRCKVCGTPGFMAPEQIANAETDERTDIYALGAILYSLLTMQTPLSDHEADEIVDLTQRGAIPPPEDIDSGVPAALSAVCRKAMASDRALRYATVSELRDDVVAFMNGYAPQAEKASYLKQAGLFLLRHFWESMLVVALILAGILGLVLYLTVLID